MGASGSPSPFAAELLEALRRRLPAVDIAGAVRIDAGLQSTAYRIGDWVIRVPRPVESARRMLERQASLHRVLAGRGLPVPCDADVLRGSDGLVIAGIHRYLPGEPAAAARRTPRLARDLGAFLGRLHATPIAEVTPFCEVLDDLWRGRFEERWQRCRPHLPAAERAWLEGIIAAFLAAPERSSAVRVLVHGDLAEEHVLVGEDGGLAGVIDPSGPRIADPALEFGTLAERFGGHFTEAVLAAYPLPREPGFTERVRFCARVRPLITMEIGLRHGVEGRVKLALARLTAGMAEAGARR